MIGYLYTLPNCPSCSAVKLILRRKGWEWQEIPINNPLLEYGVQSIFRDKKVHAPVFVHPELGIFITGQADQGMVLLKVISFQSKDIGVLSEPQPVGEEAVNLL